MYFRRQYWQTSCFYALSVGLEITTSTPRSATTRIGCFYALSVGLGITTRSSSTWASRTFLCPLSRARDNDRPKFGIGERVFGFYALYVGLGITTRRRPVS